MAFMFVDILYARINIAFSTVILFATLCVFLFFKGEEDGKKIWYALSGVSFGLTLYFYNAAKLLPVVFVLYFIYRLLVSKDSREALFRNKLSYAVFLVSAVIAFSPIIAFIIKNPDVYFIRLRQTSHFASLDFLKNLNYSFLAIFNGAASYFQMLIAKGGLSGQWNITMKQYFDGLTAFFFIVGLAYLVSDFKNRKNSFLLIWFIAGIAGGVLSITAEGSTGHRATLAFPCFGIFAAIGLDKCLNVLRYINNDRVVKVAKVAVISVIFFFVAYINLNNYFYVYSNDAAMRLERKPYYGQIAKTMAASPHHCTNEKRRDTANMRTTLDIDDDLLSAAKELARREGTTASEVVSRLLRHSLTGVQMAVPSSKASLKAVAGFVPFSPRPGVVITNDQVNSLRDQEGI